MVEIEGTETVATGQGWSSAHDVHGESMVEKEICPNYRSANIRHYECPRIETYVQREGFLSIGGNIGIIRSDQGVC